MLCFNYTVGFPLSVPVLSRLFVAWGAEAFRDRYRALLRQPLPATQIELNQTFQTTDPQAQPSEPILFPKLRIHFADFPYLHCSID